MNVAKNMMGKIATAGSWIKGKFTKKAVIAAAGAGTLAASQGALAVINTTEVQTAVDNGIANLETLAPYVLLLVVVAVGFMVILNMFKRAG